MKNRVSPLKLIRILSSDIKSSIRHQAVPFSATETAIPVFYLVLGLHEFVAISLYFVTFLMD